MDKPKRNRSPMNDEYIYRKFIVRPTKEQVNNLKFRLKMIMRPFYGYKYKLIIRNRENERSKYNLKMVNQVQGKHQKFYSRSISGSKIRINKKGIPYKRQEYVAEITLANKPSEEAVNNLHMYLYRLMKKQQAAGLLK